MHAFRLRQNSENFWLQTQPKTKRYDIQTYALDGKTPARKAVMPMPQKTRQRDHQTANGRPSFGPEKAILPPDTVCFCYGMQHQPHSAARRCNQKMDGEASRPHAPEKSICKKNCVQKRKSEKRGICKTTGLDRCPWGQRKMQNCKL